MKLQLVWFKRDLRVHDHHALVAAAARGPVLALYVIEPGLWAQPDMATQHYQFVLESLRPLARELAALGGRLQVVTGEVVAVLERLHRLRPLDTVHAHEETGNAWTYARDRAVTRWCQAQGVGWMEYPQCGVVRRLASRDHWHTRWEHFMTQPRWTPPRLQTPDWPWDEPPPPTAAALGLFQPDPPHRQRGGRPQALALWQGFVQGRASLYRGGISSPLSAPNACSRLSPYLAWGCVSVRELVQASRQTQAHAATPEAVRQGLRAFESRLHWHCHFMQKLESEPELEWRNLHRGYDGLREGHDDPARLQALMDGRTGWPLVDACVTMLRQTGWINFRMRAMLVSVAAYPLWLHWRPVGLWLAQQFLDYEPGIHWSQLQMQSGTTGINTTRVYNPIKQAQDHDPQGRFVRQWLPVLRRVPDAWLFEPWRMPEAVQAHCGVRVGAGPDADPNSAWPQPQVDLAQATREGKARLHARRRDPQVHEAKAAIVQRHGSRQRPAARRSARANPPSDDRQGALF